MAKDPDLSSLKLNEINHPSEPVQLKLTANEQSRKHSESKEQGLHGQSELQVDPAYEDDLMDESEDYTDDDIMDVLDEHELKVEALECGYDVTESKEDLDGKNTNLIVDDRSLKEDETCLKQGEITLEEEEDEKVNMHTPQIIVDQGREENELESVRLPVEQNQQQNLSTRRQLSVQSFQQEKYGETETMATDWINAAFVVSNAVEGAIESMQTGKLAPSPVFKSHRRQSSGSSIQAMDLSLLQSLYPEVCQDSPYDASDDVFLAEDMSRSSPNKLEDEIIIDFTKMSRKKKDRKPVDKQLIKDDVAKYPAADETDKAEQSSIEVQLDEVVNCVERLKENTSEVFYLGEKTYAENATPTCKDSHQTIDDVNHEIENSYKCKDLSSNATRTEDDSPDSFVNNFVEEEIMNQVKTSILNSQINDMNYDELTIGKKRIENLAASDSAMSEEYKNVFTYKSEEFDVSNLSLEDDDNIFRQDNSHKRGDINDETVTISCVAQTESENDRGSVDIHTIDDEIASCVPVDSSALSTEDLIKYTVELLDHNVEELDKIVRMKEYRVDPEIIEFESDDWHGMDESMDGTLESLLCSGSNDDLIWKSQEDNFIEIDESSNEDLCIIESLSNQDELDCVKETESKITPIVLSTEVIDKEITLEASKLSEEFNDFHDPVKPNSEETEDLQHDSYVQLTSEKTVERSINNEDSIPYNIVEEKEVKILNDNFVLLNSEGDNETQLAKNYVQKSKIAEITDNEHVTIDCSKHEIQAEPKSQIEPTYNDKKDNEEIKENLSKTLIAQNLKPETGDSNVYVYENYAYSHDDLPVEVHVHTEDCLDKRTIENDKERLTFAEDLDRIDEYAKDIDICDENCSVKSTEESIGFELEDVVPDTQESIQLKFDDIVCDTGEYNVAFTDENERCSVNAAEVIDKNAAHTEDEVRILSPDSIKYIVRDFKSAYVQTDLAITWKEDECKFDAIDSEPNDKAVEQFVSKVIENAKQQLREEEKKNKKSKLSQRKSKRKDPYKESFSSDPASDEEDEMESCFDCGRCTIL